MSPASTVPRSWQKRSRRASRTGGGGGASGFAKEQKLNRNNLIEALWTSKQIYNNTTSNYHQHFFRNFAVLCLVWNGQLSKYTMSNQARSWNNDSATSRRRMLNPQWETRRCHANCSAFKMHDIDDVTGKWWRSRKKLYFSEQNANHVDSELEWTSFIFRPAMTPWQPEFWLPCRNFQNKWCGTSTHNSLKSYIASTFWNQKH